MAKSFDRLREQVDRRPGGRRRVEELKREMDAIELSELRRSLEVTQEQLAAHLRMSQENVSRIERQDDLYLSTLSGYVAGLGGELQVTAVFPDRKVSITTAAATNNSRR